MKKPINSKVHGVLDYSVSALVAASPWLLRYGKKDNAARWVPVALGATSVLYSLFTRYELGAKPALSMKNHLRLDTGAAIATAGAPWLFGFAKKTFVPLLIFGLMELAVVALTDPREPVDKSVSKSWFI